MYRHESDHQKKFMKVFEAVARKSEGQIVFTYSDLDLYAKRWKLTSEDLPIIVANIPKQNELKKLRFDQSKLDEFEINSFVREVILLKVPKLHDYPDRVRTLTALNVNEVLSKLTQPTLVLYFDASN